MKNNYDIDIQAIEYYASNIFHIGQDLMNNKEFIEEITKRLYKKMKTKLFIIITPILFNICYAGNIYIKENTQYIEIDVSSKDKDKIYQSINNQHLGLTTFQWETFNFQGIDGTTSCLLQSIEVIGSIQISIPALSSNSQQYSHNFTSIFQQVKMHEQKHRDIYVNQFPILVNKINYWVNQQDNCQRMQNNIASEMNLWVSNTSQLQNELDSREGSVTFEQLFSDF